MAKGFIPKVSSKDIDMEKYGGKGKIRVFAYSPQMVIDIYSDFTNTMIDNGLTTVEEAHNNQEELVKRFNGVFLQKCVKNCVFFVDDANTKTLIPLDEDDVQYMSPTIYQEISEIMTEINKFPLAQTNGEESKKEQSKPLEEES